MKRRFRRQPFILLSFSSSKKLRKSQETQSYQRFQHIVHTVFNTSGTNAPRSLSHLKVGTHSARRRIAHKGSHAETGAFQTVVVSLPRTVPHVSETLRGQGVERQTLPLWGLGRGYSRRTQRACGTAMRSCALLSRGVAAPLGCVALLPLLVQPDLLGWKDLTRRSGRVTITRNSRTASRLALVWEPLRAVK